MKGLSVYQPWASFLALGIKPVENRTWNPYYRGPVAIHASSRWDAAGYRWICQHQDALGLISVPPRDYFNLGGFVGIANLTDVVTEHRSPWFFGPFGFVLKDAREIRFLQYKGKPSLFYLPQVIISDLNRRTVFQGVNQGKQT